MSKKHYHDNIDLSTSKNYGHLNDTDLFLKIINAIASAKMSWDITAEFGLTITELKVIKNSQQFKAFKEAYFSDVRDAVDFSHQSQLKLFSKYDEIALRELLKIGLESEKEAFKIQALKTYLTHAGISRGQVQDKEYQQLREMVEELTTNQDEVVV